MKIRQTINTYKKIYDLLSIVGELFEEITISDSTIKIKIKEEKKLIIENSKSILITSPTIVLNSDKVYNRSNKISPITQLDIEANFNNVEKV